MITFLYNGPRSSEFPGSPILLTHSYYMFCSGIKGPSGYYATRRDAEDAMNSYCQAHGIKLECTERDRHERKYSDHHGVRFYINRV